jgi:hypothetical protein
VNPSTACESAIPAQPKSINARRPKRSTRQSLRDQGRAEEAREVREQFDRAWKAADVILNASAF